MRRLLLPVLLLLIEPTVHAQAIELYGTFSPIHVSGARTGGGAPNYTTSNFWAPGVGGGVTFGILPIGPVRLGLDLRGSTKPGTDGADTAMAGLKLGLKIPFVAVKPYIQASGGYIGTRAKITSGVPAGSSERDKFAGFEFLGGADIPIAPFFDLRAIEVGAGHGYNFSGVGDTAGNYGITIFTLNTGLVFHF